MTASILIIDNDQLLLDCLAQATTQLGYQVATARDAAAAIAMLAEHTFDAIILDLQISPVNGWAVIEYLRVSTTRLPAWLVLSAQVDVPMTVSAMRAGAFDVLQKPIRIAELASRLEASLEARAEQGSPPGSPLAKTPCDGARSGSRIKIAPPRTGVKRLCGDSRELERVRTQITSLARFQDVSALIVGETGTGKEVVASAIHDLTSPAAPFVSINCAAIPEELFESELFGHEAGAFTGARGARAGLFEAAEDGTLFLDEVGEMPAHLQPKLLRVLQTRTFRRIGGREERPLRARVVSATNRELSAKEQDGMRSDLYFRLAGFTIALPALRERLADLETLANGFLREFAERYAGLPTRFDHAAMETLLAYRWPGNVRELRAVVERAAMLSRTGSVDREAVCASLRQGSPELEALHVGAGLSPTFSSAARDVAAPTAAPRRTTLVPVSAPPSAEPQRSPSGPVDLNEIQRQLTLEAFEQHDGNLARAARHLSIPRTTLRGRLRRYGVL